MKCQRCHSAIGRRYVVREHGEIRIVVECDECRNPDTRPTWLKRLSAHDLTGWVRG